MPTSCRRVLVPILSILLAVVPTAFAWMPPGQNAEPTILHKGVQDGLIQADAEGIVMGFQQPMIQLHLLADEQSTLAVSVLPGTLLTPDEAGFAQLIVAEAVTTELESEITIQLAAFTLSPEEAAPSVMASVRYHVSGMADPQIQTLLHDIMSRELQGEYGAQVAIWSSMMGVTVDDLDSQLNPRLTPEELSLAKGLIDPGQMEESDLPGETATNPTELPAATPHAGQQATAIPEPTLGEASFPWLIVLGGFVLIALAGAALPMLLGGLRSARSNSSQTAGEVNKSRPELEQNKAPDERPSAHMPGARFSQVGPLEVSSARNITEAQPVESKVLKSSTCCLALEWCEGTRAGIIFEIDDMVIVGRNALPIVVIGDPRVSSPHLFVEWTLDGVRVKDLNSANGVLVDGDRIGSKRVSLPTSSVVQLGGSTITILPDGVQIGQRVETAQLGALILGRDSIKVLELGADEGKISDPHALVYHDEGHWHARDLNSTNGTFVNGERLGRSGIELRDGTLLKMGNLVFKCHINESEDMTASFEM